MRRGLACAPSDLMTRVSLENHPAWVFLVNHCLSETAALASGGSMPTKFEHNLVQEKVVDGAAMRAHIPLNPLAWR